MPASRAAPLLPVSTSSGQAANDTDHVAAEPRPAVTPFGVATVDAPSIPADRPGLFDALAPLVSDVVGTQGSEIDADPFQALIADIAIQRSRQRTGPQGEGRRDALLRAIAEMAETHAVAADLACEEAAIDLPLDLPDPCPSHDAGEPPSAAAEHPARAMLIVPDMIRACRDRLARHTTAADRKKIDVVATLFDHVLADDRIATDARNTLARLQLPVLRMALADDSFFASDTHPTRRLLDRLVASAADWHLDTVGGRNARIAFDGVVRTVIRGSFENAGEHARLLDQYERAIIDIAAAASAKPVEPLTDAEDRDVLVIKATIQISQLLAGIEVDRAIRVFLLDVWSRVLVEIACRLRDDGRDASLARAKRLCFDLAWTTAPKTTAAERARLAGLLPTMIAAIRDGLHAIDHPEADERAFFAEWTRVLAHAVRSSPGAPFRIAQPGSENLGIDAFARHLREVSFGPEHGVEREACTSQTRCATGVRAADHVMPILSRVDAPTQPSTIADAPILIGSLRKGDCFELRHAGVVARVRLSWISPLRSFYLFVGADSTLTRSLDPAALADLIERGDLRPAAV